jgi:hypothetical protein
MRSRVDVEGPSAILAAAGRAIPRSLRAAAFAIAADLVLADGRMDRAEGRFLDGLAGDLGLTPEVRDDLRNAMVVKNSV